MKSGRKKNEKNDKFKKGITASLSESHFAIFRNLFCAPKFLCHNFRVPQLSVPTTLEELRAQKIEGTESCGAQKLRHRNLEYDFLKCHYYTITTTIVLLYYTTMLLLY